MGKILGIDLGTTNSQAAVLEGGRPVIIPSAEGATFAGKMFPSVVAFTKDGQRLVGEPARRQAITNPEGTVQAIKRKMGTDQKIRLNGKRYTPQEISAMILQKIKNDAEAFLGETVTEVVITVPAYFNDNQRQATKDAGKIAGLDVKRIINEPTAAALAYGLEKTGDNTILILDLGGGTFDVTVMEMGDGVFQVKSTSGDTKLGGRDMDNALLMHVLRKYKKDAGVDLSKDDQAVQRIRDAVEKAKIELSTVMETEINLPFITQVKGEPKHLEMTITRAKLEELIAKVLGKLDGPIQKAFKDAKITPKDVDKVILVGGPTRMPSVQKKFEEIIGVAPERGIDPMECVAMGAAIQGGVLAGDVRDVLLLDVTPLSLGLETLGGVFTKLIDRNTTIPVRKSEIFSTADDNQPAVDIHVLQGERPMARDNTRLGIFSLVGIPPAPRGVPKIEVTFDIDANGILNVTAKDLATGNKQDMTIMAPMKLDEGKIDEMVRDAEKFAEEDKRTKERVETKNHADQTVYTTRKMLKQFEGKVSDGQVSKINTLLDKLEKAKEEEDVEKMKSLMEQVNEAFHEISEKLYQGVGGSGQGAEGCATGSCGAGAGMDGMGGMGAGSGPWANAQAQGQPRAKRQKVAADEDVVDVDYEEMD